jgi:deoxyribodipyrimidine photolyase-related protein
MATYADGGEMMSKPYAAGGRYINRMSDYCGGCRYRPERRTGPDACPFTAMYWDFLDRNRDKLMDNRRMRLQLRNLERIDPEELDEVRAAARAARRDLAG